MNIVDFSTELLPASQRLAAFRRGASDFQVDALDDSFSSRWQMLKLGELNAIRATVSSIRYRRDQAMIEADGEDRVAVHCYNSGGSTGMLDDRAIDAGPAEATVWDLSRSIDMRTLPPLEVLIVTLPRFMLDEVLPAASYSCKIPASPELALATDQLSHVIDHAAELPDDAAPYIGRALRDLFAVAMLPVINPLQEGGEITASPLFLRMCRLIDAQPDRNFDEAEIAVELHTDMAAVSAVTMLCGSLDELVERRRLLAAYRLLCDPSEAAPIATIAWRCGFRSTSRFNRVFRDVFHATPKDLRRFRRANLPKWAGAYHVERKYGALISS